MDFNNITTTIFTSIEFGRVGLTEEEAIRNSNNDVNKIEMTITYILFMIVLLYKTYTVDFYRAINCRYYSCL